MTEQKPTFSELAEQFTRAAHRAKSDAADLPFVTLQYSALMAHQAESDDEKKQLTADAASVAAYWYTRCSKPDYNGHFIKGPEFINPMLDALQAPDCLPFVPKDAAQAIADACVALAANGPTLLKKAGAGDASDNAADIIVQNREALLQLTRRALEFADKHKEFRENLNLEAKTSKDITPVKRIELRTGAPSNV